MSRTRSAVLVTVGALALTPFAAVATAQAAPAGGRATVTVLAPNGVPATVTVVGGAGRQATAKAPGDLLARRGIGLAPGSYGVTAPPVEWNGVRYVPRTAPGPLTIAPGKDVDLTVSYVADAGATRLRVADATATGLSFAWNGPAGAGYQLRRATGTAPHTPAEGEAVPVTGTTATDTPPAGTSYLYSLFTVKGDAVTGPLVLTAGLAAGDRGTFAAPPTTVLEAAGVTAVAADGSGRPTVTFAPSATVPPVGGAVVLPADTRLPGGFLGQVTSLSPDGLTATLRPTGLGTAFDLLELDVPIDGAAQQVPAGDAVPAPAVNGTACGQTRGPAPADVTYRPQVALSGRFTTTVDRFAPSVAAKADFGVRLTVTGAAEVHTGAAYACSVELPGIVQVVSAVPVPIAVAVQPTARIGVGGKADVTDLGLTATAGFDGTATIDRTGGTTVTATPVATAAPLTPRVSTGPVEVTARAGAAITVGPGAGVGPYGVVAGLRGTVNVLDVKGTVVPAPRCSTLAAGAGFDLDLVAQAWVGVWSTSASVPLLSRSVAYPGSPWKLPQGCTA